MSADCPFCAQPVVPQALVCSSCGRDIVVPASLVVERDKLILKRDAMRDELAHSKAELERLRRRLRIPMRQS